MDFLSPFPKPPPHHQAQWQAGSKLLGFVGAVCQPLASLSGVLRFGRGFALRVPLRS